MLLSAYSAFSAVKASVRPPALLRNPRGEEVCATACLLDIKDREILGWRAMKVRYDEEADALYIRLRKGEYYESDEIKEGFILDYDANGNIVGIEILDASSNLTVADLPTVNFEVSRQLTKAGQRVSEVGKTWLGASSEL